jgi:transcriptional regulator with XRE-family HTH domain
MMLGMAKKRGPRIGTLDEVVGRNIRTAREAKGLSHTTFGGDHEGVGAYLAQTWPKQVVSKIERGLRSLDASELVASALVLRVPVSRLLTGTDAAGDDAEIDLSDDFALTIAELRAAVTARHEADVRREAARVAVAQLLEAAKISEVTWRGSEVELVFEGAADSVTKGRTKRKERDR